MEAFQLRMWDGRLGRWLSPDPYGQYASPYLGMGNNPMNLIDPDGGQTDDWWKNKDGKYVWKNDDGYAVYADHEYIGTSLSDVRDHYNANTNWLTRLFSGPSFGDTSGWSGELSTNRPDFWDRQESGNFLQQTGYGMANGFYTTSQMFIGRNVGSGSMKNLSGTSTTTEEGVLGFAGSAMSFIPYIKGIQVAKVAANKPQSLIQANRAAGNLFRDQLADALRAEGRTVYTEVFKKTPFGPRYMDLDVWLDGVNLGGIEAKVGGSRYHTLQRLKDAWLGAQKNPYPVQLVRKPSNW
jgi:hypothetical protein